jgi:hypothetical protein
MAVTATTSPTFSVGAPHRLLEGRYEASDAARNYDVAPDGRHFVAVRSDETASAPQLHVVLNWFAEITRHAVSGR